MGSECQQGHDQVNPQPGANENQQRSKIALSFSKKNESYHQSDRDDNTRHEGRYVSKKLLEPEKKPGPGDVQQAELIRINRCRHKKREEEQHTDEQEMIGEKDPVSPEMIPGKKKKEQIERNHMVQINPIHPMC